VPSNVAPQFRQILLSDAGSTPHFGHTFGLRIVRRLKIPPFVSIYAKGLCLMPLYVGSVHWPKIVGALVDSTLVCSRSQSVHPPEMIMPAFGSFK
jgi:hypothetical protein